MVRFVCHQVLPHARRTSAALLLCLLAVPSLAADAQPTKAPAPVQPYKVLALARREATMVPVPTARAVAMAEVALMMERAGDREVAKSEWQRAQFEAVSTPDELDRVLARSAVAKRMLKSALMKDQVASFVTDVYKSALALKVARDRSQGLRTVAPLVAATSPDNWTKVIAQAAEAALLIPESIVRASSYAQLARVATDRAPRLARELAGEGEKAWHFALPSEEKDFAAAELARAWAPLDWQHAIDLSTSLTEPQAMAQALKAAADELATRDLDKALVAVQHTPGPEFRAVALASVAVPAAAKRPDLAAMLAEQALALVKKSKPPVRDAVLASAAPAIAATDPKHALALVKTMKDDDLRASATVAVATILSQHDAAKAVAVLDGLDRPELVEPALPEILGRLAAKDPADALKRAGNILERYLRVVALCRIYDALVPPAKQPAAKPAPAPAAGPAPAPASPKPPEGKQ